MKYPGIQTTRNGNKIRRYRRAHLREDREKQVQAQQDLINIRRLLSGTQVEVRENEEVKASVERRSGSSQEETTRLSPPPQRKPQTFIHNTVKQENKVAQPR